MTYFPKNIAQIHINVMEILVKEEIEKQLKFYPKNLKCYLNQIEISAYALNRLPPLYASSKRGEEQQKRIGKQKYKEQITLAVRRALAAVERDPLRKSTPILSETIAKYEVANIALEKLQNFLSNHHLINQNETLTWNNLNVVVQKILKKFSDQDSEDTSSKIKSANSLPDVIKSHHLKQKRNYN